MGPTFIRTFNSRFKLGPMYAYYQDGSNFYFQIILIFLDFGIPQMCLPCSQKVLMVFVWCSFQFRMGYMFPKSKKQHREGRYNHMNIQFKKHTYNPNEMGLNSYTIKQQQWSPPIVVPIGNNLKNIPTYLCKGLFNGTIGDAFIY